MLLLCLSNGKEISSTKSNFLLKPFSKCRCAPGKNALASPPSGEAKLRIGFKKRIEILGVSQKHATQWAATQHDRD